LAVEGDTAFVEPVASSQGVVEPPLSNGASVEKYKNVLSFLEPHQRIAEFTVRQLRSRRCSTRVWDDIRRSLTIERHGAIDDSKLLYLDLEKLVRLDDLSNEGNLNMWRIVSYLRDLAMKLGDEKLAWWFEPFPFSLTR
jgi:hypothetical protein